MNRSDPLGLGVIGCGGFGLFALQHFTQHPDVKLVSMAATRREAALAAARRFGLPVPTNVAELCARDDVDLVYIATPPFLHFEHAQEALHAGKHVICEKPLTTDPAQAGELLRYAEEHDLLLVANLMQRYNPLFCAVKRVIDDKVLGDVLHGYFENYASDEGLDPSHWFWDPKKSGGILIEHGVHFFDLFAGWLGQGKMESAQYCRRFGTSIVDQAHCTVRYSESLLVSFYHGFTQPACLDRQELRLVFERGDLLLTEWIPTRGRIYAAVDEGQTRQLMELFPGARLNVTTTLATKDRKMTGRHKELDVQQIVEIHFAGSQHKLHLYGDLLRDFIDDQIKWIRDRTHVRRVTGAHSREALAMAWEADRLAKDAGFA